MEGVSCPQCGNPNLDVDAQNNVVFCRKCGFAVQVDPATGNVTPLSQGAGAPSAGGGTAGVPAAYSSSASGHKLIFGTDPLTFLLLSWTVISLLLFAGIFDDSLAFFALIVFFVYYWFHK